MSNALLVHEKAETNHPALGALKKVNLECQAVTSINDALGAIAKSNKDKKPFEVVVLDTSAKESLDILKQIRSDEKATKNAPKSYVILITDKTESFMEAFNQGCDDYLLKPFTPDKLLLKIQNRKGS